jgi:hypothetical protein
VAPIFASEIDYSPPALFDLEIGPRALVRSRENEIRTQMRLAVLPDLILHLLEFLVAMGVLAIWWRTRTRTLFWFAAFVLAWSVMGLLLLWVSNAPGAPHLTYWSITWAGWLTFDLALIQFMKCAADPPGWTIPSLRAVCLAWVVMAFSPVPRHQVIRGLPVAGTECRHQLAYTILVGLSPLHSHIIVRLGQDDYRCAENTISDKLVSCASSLRSSPGVFPPPLGSCFYRCPAPPLRKTDRKRS